MAVSASLFISIEGKPEWEEKHAGPKNPVSSSAKPVHGAAAASADWWKNDSPGNKNHSATQDASLSG